MKKLLCGIVAVIIVTVSCGCSYIPFYSELFFGSNEAQESYDILSPEDKIQTVYEKMVSGIENGEEKIAFDFDCSDELSAAYERIIYECPQFFWLTGSSTYERQVFGNSVKIVFIPSVYIGKDDILGYSGKLDKAYKTLVSGINSGMDDYEKVLYIHDYIVDNTVYNSESAALVMSDAEDSELDGSVHASTTVYGCLVNRSAICSGYSAAFKYICDKIGMECSMVLGEDIKTGEGHQWNCVKVNGDYYYLDITWDDPVVDEGETDQRLYDYFLVNYDEICLTHKFDEGQNLPECTATEENYYVKNGLYLEKYVFSNYAGIINERMKEGTVSVKFSDPDQAKTAMDDLFENERFWKINIIKRMNPEHIYTTVSSGGNIITVMTD